MKAKISLITLGVADFQRSVRFYHDGLGLPLKGEADAIAFFEMEGTWLALYPREQLAADACVENTAPGGFAGFTIAHNVTSPEAVDAMLQHAVGAGARLVKAGQKAEWGGYSGYFADPDGFLWEVAWNPFMDLT
jgi:catechol 2,3-dioxygenase-like lactoylglutathione lyase family enzyme